MNITMLVKDRPRLTEQALDSLRANTVGPYTLTIVHDGRFLDADDQVEYKLAEETVKGAAVLYNESSKGVTGMARNLAIFWSQTYFGRDSDGILYLADNDSYFTYGWDQPIREALKTREHVIVGGQNHPFHQPIGETDCGPYKIREYVALAGTSWAMKWSTWDKFGPLHHGAPGVCQGEDWVFTEKLRKAGGRLFGVWPHVVYDCGITQTGGKLSPGAEHKERVDGVIYE